MKAIVFIPLFFITLCVSAQRPLEFKNISKAGDTHSTGDNIDARVTITAAKNIKPYFNSMQTSLLPVETDTLGDEIHYHLELDVKHYPGRNLEINVNGFSPLILPLINLRPNEWVRYNIYDPDPTIIDCYNQLTREGLNLFKSGIYKEARKKFEASRECSNVKNKEEIDKRISLIDSIMMWRNMADAACAIPDYPTAIKYLLNIYQSNADDNFVINRLAEVQTIQRTDCAANFRMAETFFMEKDYKSAKPLYEKVVDQSCNENTAAIIRLHELIVKEQRPQVLTWEFSKNTPIGLSTGNYKDHKSSGYFTIRLNSDLFELLRTDGDEKLKPELNVSFGWTLRPMKEAPVWIFLGPGYTGVGQYSPKNDDDLQQDKDKKLVLNINHAISPEIGLLGKIIIPKTGIGIVLRYTYQYRFALEKEMQNYIGKTRHIFGIGLCF